MLPAARILYRTTTAFGKSESRLRVASCPARCNIIGALWASMQPLDLNPATAVAGVSCWGVDDAPSNLASLGYHWLSMHEPRHRQ
jgi:hypothetical protein